MSCSRERSDMALLLIKASRKEQRSVIGFLWAKQTQCNANAIHSEMRPNAKLKELFKKIHICQSYSKNVSGTTDQV